MSMDSRQLPGELQVRDKCNARVPSARSQVPNDPERIFLTHEKGSATHREQQGACNESEHRGLCSGVGVQAVLSSAAPEDLSVS